MQTGVLSTNAGSGNSLKVDQHLRQDLRSGACSETTEGALFCPVLKMIQAPSNEGACLVSATPPTGGHRGWVLVTVGVYVPSPLVRPCPWAGGFFFGNTELSLELWTVIAGISGFDD